jgi:hypothetical protein
LLIPIIENEGVWPLRRTEFGRKYHPFVIEITPYIAIGIIASPPNKKEYTHRVLAANKVHTTRTKNSPS